MRTLGFLVTGVMVAAIAACAAGSESASQGADLTASTDAAVATDGGASSSDASAPVTDAAVADAAAAVPTYDEVAPIIEASCAGCHDDQFATLDAVKESGLSMLVLINKGRMPKGDPTFKTTADGQKLVTYLTSSPDLQP